MGWVGLRPEFFIWNGLGWVGSNSVKYDSLPKSTALVNATTSTTDHFYVLHVYLEFYSVHHNVLVALFVLHQQRKLAEIHLLI